MSHFHFPTAEVSNDLKSNIQVSVEGAGGLKKKIYESHIILNGYAAKDGFIAVEKTIRSGLGLAP